MHFSKNLYLSKELEENKNKVLSDVKYQRGSKSYYLIYHNIDNDALECMKSVYFKQKFFSSRPYLVEAVLNDYDEALKYLALKTADSYNVVFDDE